MKKLISLAISVVTFSLISCNENSYTCKCIDDSSGNVFFSQQIKAENELDAQIKCRSIGNECIVE